MMVCNGYGFRNALYLNNLKLLNISVMVVSVFMLFVGYDLLTNYFMDSRFFSALGFEFWPISVLPVVFIGIGLATLITSVGCFICSVFQSKRPVIGYAILMMFLVLGKFGCLFLTFKAQGLIERKLTYITKSEPDDKIVKLYSNDKEFRNYWDALQTRLRCCGSGTYEDFFRNTTSDCFPSSCSISKMDSQNRTCVKMVRIITDKKSKMSSSNSNLLFECRIILCLFFVQSNI